MVRETRDFLQSNGIRLDAFNRPPGKRSSTVILVKNLPKGVDSAELQRLFARYGQTRQVLLPPGRALTAIVEMIYKDEAAKAFKALAYVRLRHQPMYLEWAPEDTFDNKHPSREGCSTEEVVEGENMKKDADEEEGTPAVKKRKLKGSELSEVEKKALRRSKKHQPLPVADEGVKEEAEEVMVKPEPAPTNSNNSNEEAIAAGEEGGGASLFVKNLSFNTTDEQFLELFTKNYPSGVKSAAVSKKCDPQNPTLALSMGFGLVHFEREADAVEALKRMQVGSSWLDLGG